MIKNELESMDLSKIYTKNVIKRGKSNRFESINENRLFLAAISAESSWCVNTLPGARVFHRSGALWLGRLRQRTGDGITLGILCARCTRYTGWER